MLKMMINEELEHFSGNAPIILPAGPYCATTTIFRPPSAKPIPMPNFLELFQTT